MHTPKFSLIIPTLNEEKGIVYTIKNIPINIRKYSEILVIDGLSTDNTVSEARKLGAKVIVEQKRGKGIQMKSGVSKAKGEILVFLDGDGTHPGKYIPKFVDKLKNCQLAMGCRGGKRFPEDDLASRLIIKFGNLLWNIILNKYGRFTEPITGFRAIRKTDWCKLNLNGTEFDLEVEMDIKLRKLGFKVEEIDIPSLKRIGKSKLFRSPKSWIKMLQAVIKYY